MAVRETCTDFGKEIFQHVSIHQNLGGWTAR